MMSYLAQPRPRLFGHRGAAGIAPENTLPSFDIAARLGAPYLELDVYATRDGTIVVFHDPTLERTTNGSGSITAASYAELQELDAGYHFTHDGRQFPWRGQGVRIPSLEAVLEAYPELCFNIEVKSGDRSVVESVVALLDNAGARERTLLAAAEDDIMQLTRAVAGDGTLTGISAGEALEFYARFAQNDWSGYRPGGRALQIPTHHEGLELVNDATLDAAHRIGLEVHVWTINDETEMKRLLALGVDGVMSDLPGMLCRVAGK